MTKLGKIVFTLIVLLLAGFAVTRMLAKKDEKARSAPHADTRGMVTPDGDSSVAASFDFIAPSKAPTWLCTKAFGGPEVPEV